MIDLHIHTTHSSDGQYRPEEILEMASLKKIRAVSFTDHMDISSAGLGREYAPRFGIEFFTGVELSTSYHDREYHLLCYGFDIADQALEEFIAHHCAKLWESAHMILDHFQSLGFDIQKQDISDWGKSVPTGVTFLDALRKRNAHDPRLSTYLYGERSQSPYLNFYQDFSLTRFGTIVTSALPPIMEALGELKDVGIFILAHPGDIHQDALAELKDNGLAGIEVYSSHHTEKLTRHLKSAAASLGLFSSAGSDFHGERIKPDIAFGDIPGRPDSALIQSLRNLSKD